MPLARQAHAPVTIALQDPLRFAKTTGGPQPGGLWKLFYADIYIRLPASSPSQMANSIDRGAIQSPIRYVSSPDLFSSK
jgi:hypothetical protein